MANIFEFATAQQIIFGAGKAAQIGDLASALGSRALVVMGSNGTRLRSHLESWQARGLLGATCSIHGEPTILDVKEGVETARAARCDLIIAIGGGSVIDSGKAIAALLTNPGDPLDYLEVVGRGQPLVAPAAPVIAVPTTAGTGAEVTRNAVLAVPDRQVKVSLRSASMLPRVALIDPELTYTMPATVTASTGLDALTQCIEPLVSNAANPLTDALAREGISRAARSLRRVYQAGNDAIAREDMAIASLCGGLALANAKLGAVHGFAGVLGGMFPMPHGVICARLLPFVLAANVAAIQARMPDSPTLARFDEVARLVTGNSQAKALEGADWLMALCVDLNLPPLRDYGMTAADFASIVEKAKIASSMKGNPIVLTDEELRNILDQAL